MKHKMNKKQTIDSLKVSLQIILVFIGAYLIMDSSWINSIQDFSTKSCISHKNDTYAEYLILDKTSKQYVLGILGNGEIKKVPLEYEFNKKNYINQFYKKVDCPTNVDKMPITNTPFINSVRNQRMLEDLENVLRKKSKQ